jgi:hypothetical protein
MAGGPHREQARARPERSFSVDEEPVGPQVEIVERVGGHLATRVNGAEIVRLATAPAQPLVVGLPEGELVIELGPVGDIGLMHRHPRAGAFPDPLREAQVVPMPVGDQHRLDIADVPAG